MLNDEVSILVLYGLLVLVTILLQTTGAMTQFGMGYLMSARDEGRTARGIVARLERALNNSVTAMALFAPAVLILAVQDAFDATTLMAAKVFLLGRVVYLPAYAFGITGVRTLAFLAGFFATAILYFQAL